MFAGAIRVRYQRATKAEKSRILNEFVAITELHRRYAIAVLRQCEVASIPQRSRTQNKIYGEAVKEALVLLWEASDRICSKRLTAILPILIESLERHNPLKLNADVHERLLSISVATIDRLLRPIR